MNKYLEKYQKEKNKKLKYDFLPSMLNIIERPANKLATVCLVLVVALIITTVIWAAIFKLDIAVTAIGAVAPKDDLITLNSQCTGRVSGIKVKEGDYVKKGDKIVILDKKEIEINITEYEHTLKELKVKQEWYNKVYKKLKGEKVSLDMDSSKDEKFSKIVEEIILEYQVYETNYKTLKSSIEKGSYEKQFELSVLESVNTVNSEIYTIESNIKKLRNELKKMNITSPVSGKISQLTVKNKEKLIAEGDVIGYIIPEDKENIFNAYVADKDIREIKKNKKVGIKIAAYDDTENEYIEGKVTYVGDIALNIKEIGSAYLVEIKIEDMPNDIKVGMEGNCNIVIGKRTVLDYFLEPFKEGFKESLKEK